MSAVVRARTRRSISAFVVVVAGAQLVACVAAPDGAGRRDSAYEQARAEYTAMADDLHAVIMAIEPTDWRVEQGQYGARPSGCQLGVSSDTGYSFTAVRVLGLPGRDPQQIAAAASDGFAERGIEADVLERGAGDAREVTVVGEGEAARTVVVIRPSDGRVLVSSETACAPGSSSDILTAMFGDELYPDDVWRRLPATEGPSSVPQFSFPPDAPLYYDEAGTPLDPQPVVTVAPTPAG